MKHLGLVGICVLFIIMFVGAISAQGISRKIDGKIFSLIESGNYKNTKNLPQEDSFFDADKWYQPPARHITNVIVGSYYFPVIVFDNLFIYWDKLFNHWSYPDSFGRGSYASVASDSKGNLHFAWHQGGNPDGYEVYYTGAILDTSAGMIQYYVERPPVMISATDGEEDISPSMCIYNDRPFVVWNHGGIGSEHAIFYYDGNTGIMDTAYEYTVPFPGSWILTSIAPDLNTGNMWVAFAFDSTGDNSMDMLALHYDAADTLWNIELVAAAQSMHPYCLPGIAVDVSGIPHIIFQKNLTNTGGINGLSGWGECGPAGTILYTGRIGGSWSSPIPLYFPRYEPCNYATGIPSVGITDDCVYFTVTQPESATPDTSAYLPFNVYYACYNPYVDTLCYGDKVNEDTINCFYPSITYFVPYTIDPSGPGIAWAEGYDVNSPLYDFRYRLMPLLCPGAGIEGTKKLRLENRNLKLTAHPNPFTQKTVIRYSSSVINDQLLMTNDLQCPALRIYDVSGRLVRSFSPFALHSSLFSSVTWDGRDNVGNRVKSGVYFLKLKVAKKEISKKVILLE